MYCMRQKGGKEKSLKAKKTSDGKYKYKMVGIYPENGEREKWKEEAKKEGIPLSEFVRDAVNSRIKDIRPTKNTLADTGELDRLKEENKELQKDNKELKNEVEQLKQEIAILKDIYTKSEGIWIDRILSVIPQDSYKKPRDILIDAGLISAEATEEEWLEAQNKFQTELKDLYERCKEPEDFPLIYKEGRGWKHK